MGEPDLNRHKLLLIIIKLDVSVLRAVQTRVSHIQAQCNPEIQTNIKKCIMVH